MGKLDRHIDYTGANSAYIHTYICIEWTKYSETNGYGPTKMNERWTKRKCDNVFRTLYLLFYFCHRHTIFYMYHTIIYYIIQYMCVDPNIIFIFVQMDIHAREMAAGLWCKTNRVIEHTQRAKYSLLLLLLLFFIHFTQAVCTAW